MPKSGMPTFDGVSHVSLSVRDCEKSAAWWQEVFGLAEVYRREGEGWRSLGRIDTTPDVVYRRVWSMAVHRSRLFCGTLPSGRVWSLLAGQGVASERALEPGWRHVAAVRVGNETTLYIDGEFDTGFVLRSGAPIDVNSSAPMLLGSGAQDFFKGRMADVRVYGRALDAAEVRHLASGGAN